MKIAKKYFVINYWENNLLLPAHAELLIAYQKRRGDGLCLITWPGSSKSAEVLERKTQPMPMGQHCSNQPFCRDLFLKHLSVLSQYSPTEGKTSSFKETSALLWNTAKLPVQVGMSCQPVPWKIHWCRWSKQSENKVVVFLPGYWPDGRLLQLSQRGTLQKLSLLYYLCSTVPCLIQLF